MLKSDSYFLEKIVTSIREIITPEIASANAVYNCGTFTIEKDSSSNPNIYALCRTSRHDLYPQVEDSPDWNAYFGLYKGTLSTPYSQIQQILPKNKFDELEINGLDKNLYKLINLEDARAYADRSNNHKIYFGVTAVVENIETKKYIPFPAVFSAILNNEEDKLEIISSLEIITNIGVGKNCTPIGSNSFIFRKDTTDHKLTWVKKNDETWEVIKIMEIPSPKKWGEHKIGLVDDPIILDDTELYILHGMKIPKKGYIKFVYGFGLLIVKSDDSQEILETPLLSYNDFVRLLKAKIGKYPPELHDFRKAIYCCGHIIVDNSLILFISYGDRNTYEVNFGDVRTIVDRVRHRPRRLHINKSSQIKQ